MGINYREWFTLKQSESDRLLGLETQIEYKERWISIRVMYFLGFLVYVTFGIVATGLWPYLNTLDPDAGKGFLAYAFGINPLLQLVGSPLFGWWNNKLASVRMPTMFLLLMVVIGGVMYAIIEESPLHRKYILLISRALVGLGSVVCTIYRAYISAATTVAERTRTVSFLSLAQAAGLLASSILQWIFSLLGDDGFMLLGLFRVNMYTAAGWLCAFLAIVNGVLMMPFIFKDHRIAAKEAMKHQGATSASAVWKSMELQYLPITLMVVAFALLMFIYSAMQTLLSPIALDQFYWTNEESLFYLGILTTVGALISCILFLMLDPLCKRFSEKGVLVYGAMFALFISQLIMLPAGSEPIASSPQTLNTSTNSSMNMSANDSTIALGCPPKQEWCQWIPPVGKAQFTISYMFLCISFSIGTTLSQAVFSKLLGPRPQGTWMALLTCAGSIARILGPGTVSLYVLAGTYWTFGFFAVFAGLIFIWMWVYRDTMRPPVLAKLGIEEEMKELNPEKPAQR